MKQTVKHRDLTPEDFNLSDDELDKLIQGARFIYGNDFTNKELPPRQPDAQPSKLPHAPRQPFKA